MLENPMKSQTECYQELMVERVDTPCSPEEQAGICATKCDECGGNTVHQYAKVCCSCGKHYRTITIHDPELPGVVIVDSVKI